MGRELDFVNVAFAVGLAFCIALIVLFLWAAVEEGRQWEAYKREHNCKVIGRMKGNLINTFDGKNVGVAYTGDKTGWRCDDGMEYWR